MSTNGERQLVLDLLTERRSFTDLPGRTRAKARKSIERYLADKAWYGPPTVPTKVRAATTILRDARGVPHIAASDPYDLFFAHGYAQAQDRLWQMDYLRRWSHGRLAEVFGPDKLAEDIITHTLGITELSQAILDTAQPESRDMFLAFADGVNAWMETLPAGLPIEFELLEYEPEPWSAVDSVAILRRWTWYLTGRLPVISTPECVRMAIGEREAEFYQPDGPITYIVPPGSYDPEPRWLELPMAEPADLAWGPQEPGGSNNWAVAPDLTAGGYGMVGSDPHVYFNLPSDLTEVHLHGAGYDVVGAAYAGVPIPRIGRNPSLAWGITNNICMQRDLYVERLHPHDEDRYLDGDEWIPVEHRSSEIGVRGETPHTLDIRFAHGRPIVDHMVAEAAWPRNLWPEERGANTSLSLAWVGLEVSDEPKAFMGLCRARTVEEGRQALSGIRCATWNYVLADTAGSVAYQCTGALPLRGRTRRGYRDANDPVDAWGGYVPFDGLPRLENPARGWVASANNPAAPPDFPYPLNGTWMVEDRAARAETLLEALKPHTEESFAEMQNDVLSGRAVRGIPPMLEVLAQGDDSRFPKIRQILREWDRDLNIIAPGGSIYFVFFWRWHQNVIRQRFPEHLATQVQDAGWGLSASLLHGDPTGWFASDDLRRETIRLAMSQALDWLTERLGDDPALWFWGMIHRLGAVHPVARTALQHELLDIEPSPAAGGAGTVNSSHYVPAGTFDARIGPIYRIISVLDPDSTTEAVSWPGQSGHPGSPHYRDQSDLHLAGAYYVMPFAWDDVVTQATNETRLVPAP
jgi:penicillin amidase